MASKARLGRDPLAKIPGGAAAKPTAPSRPQKAKPAAGAGRAKPKAVASATVVTAPPVVETPSKPVEPQDSGMHPDAARVAPPPAVSTVATDPVVPDVAVAASGPTRMPPDSVPPATPQDVSPPPEAVSAQPIETTAADTKDTPAIPTPEAAPTATPLYGPHPVEVFLHSVLEGLPTTEGLAFSVEVDAASATLPAEKLFYFSHILQLLLAPLDCALAAWRKPGRECDTAASLTVRLAHGSGTRHCLRVADNGLFFRSYLPELALDTEPLRPLLLFVIKRGGSICLKQGRCVEFEITG